MDIKLVKAKNVDITFLLKLRKLTMEEHLQQAKLYVSDEEHLARIKFKFDDAYIVKRLDDSVGLLKYIETKVAIEILQFQILPDHQRKGIGKYIIDYMIQLATTLNKNLLLKVLKENPARYLYKRNGFQTFGEDQYEFHMKYEGRNNGE